MATILEMALLSMDVYEQAKTDGNLNPTGNIASFSRGQRAGSENGFFAQEYLFSGGKVLAYAGTNDLTSGDIWADIGGTLGYGGTDQYLHAAQFYQARNGDSVATNTALTELGSLIQADAQTAVGDGGGGLFERQAGGVG